MNLLQLLNSLNVVQTSAVGQGAAKALRNFLFGELPEILDQLNDIQWKAASMALVNNPLSNQDTDRVARALTHLATAYVVAYKATEYPRQSPLALLHAYEQACEAALLIAFCQRYLQHWDEARRYAKIARASFESYKGLASKPYPELSRDQAPNGLEVDREEREPFVVPYMAEKEQALQQFLDEVIQPYP